MTVRKKFAQIVLSFFTNRTICYIILLLNKKGMINLNRLRELRLERGLLQSDIAKIVGKKDRIIGFYETGERDPSTETVIKLAEFFNVSTDYLLGKSDVRNPEKVDIDDIDIAFSDGIKGLNKENQEIAKNIIEGLLAKQKNEENKGDKK